VSRARTWEASQGMLRLMGSRQGVNACRKANVLEKWRKGRSSQNVGKPRTPGWGLTAKVPSLRKDGTKGTQRRRKPNTENVPWSWGNGNRRFMDSHGE